MVCRYLSSVGDRAHAFSLDTSIFRSCA
jgi:hypothetical protein